jgi:hypothetical protein
MAASKRKCFIVVRDEEGKERRIRVQGDQMSYNADSCIGTWVERATMPVVRFEVETDGEVIPMLAGKRTAVMEIW